MQRVSPRPVRRRRAMILRRADIIMKKRASRESKPEGGDQAQARPDIEGKAEPQVIEQIVEDLEQQDVLPTQSGDAIASENEPQMVGVDEISERPESWNNALGGRPHSAGRNALEDEVATSELLVERGITEAADELSELDAIENPPDDNS
jgi:hypothetical protein